MKRIVVATTAGLLLLPAVAGAKAGIEFQRYPDTAKVGEKIDFTVIAMREPPSGGGGRSQPQALAGRHPLVTFRSRSGAVVRVRTGATDADGIAKGQVSFTDKGPWT